MTAKLYVRGGSGLGGGTEIPHISEITEFAPSFEGKQPLIELGMSFANGSASQGTFVTNPTEMFGTPGGVFAPHAQVTWTEDASGDELWLAQGRTSGEEEGRGIAMAEDKVEHVVTVDDANVDVRGLAFTEDWVRPAETDTDRLYALDAYILSAGSSTSPTLRYSTDITISDAHLAPDTETVTMPAKTYQAGTQPSEVINDCAESASKVWGVVIHHLAGASHLCLLYIKELDHSTFASPVKISDQVANWDPTDLTAPVFEPIWDQGKGLLFGSQSAVSGIVSRYGNGDQFVYVNNPTLEDQNEHWIDSFSDSDSVTATQAEARANAILSYRSFGDFTYRVSVVVLPEQFHLLGAGMSIQADTAVFPGGTFRGSYEDVRIIQLSWEPMPDGRYFAHMQLNRATRTLAPSRGKPIPIKPAPVCEPDEIISPTTIYSWIFTTDNKDDATSTYSIGLERTVSGGFDSYPPADGAFGSFYGQNDAGHFLSQDLPISASTLYSFRTDILWQHTPSTRNVKILWHDVSDNLLRTDQWITGAGHAVDTEYYEQASFTSPVGAATCQINWCNFAGIYADNIFIETAGSIVAADNDDFCLVSGPGESPYYAKSDDPRFASLEQQIANIEDWTSLVFNVEDYGAVHDGVTDDTVAIQAAIDAWEAAGRSGTIYFPPDTDNTNAVYLIGGALQDTSTFNSQLKIPQGSSGNITFLGPATLRSNWAGTISGNPAVMSAGLQDSLTLNQVFIRFERITIEVPLNPKLTALQMTKAATVRWSSLAIRPNGTITAVPTNTNAIGLDLPWGLNDQNSGGQELYIDGFYTGLRPSEQMIADAIYVTMCARAVEMRGAEGTPEFLAHSVSIQRLNVWFCVRGIVATGDVRTLNVSLMDVEHNDPAPFATVYDVDDASNYLRGFIRWHTTDYTTGTAIDDPLINGALGLSFHGGHAKRWRLANVVDVPTGTDPSTNPGTGRRLYTASATGNLTVRKPDGTLVDLESGGLGDHTHAATGSGANGGGNAIDVNAGTLRLPVGTGALTTTEGYAGWESTTERLRIYDGQRERAVSEVGWLPRAVPISWSPTAALGTSEALAAAGGSVAIAFTLPAHMLLQQVCVRNLDASLERTWGWDIYEQRLNNGNAGENTLDRVATGTSNETFTAGAASTRCITAASVPVYLAPGCYWVVIQNRHASNTFSVAYTAVSGSFGPTSNQTKTTTNPNGATLDFVAATWTKNSNMYGVALLGRVFGQTAGF